MVKFTDKGKNTLIVTFKTNLTVQNHHPVTSRGQAGVVSCSRCELTDKRSDQTEILGMDNVLR